MRLNLGAETGCVFYFFIFASIKIQLTVTSVHSSHKSWTFDLITMGEFKGQPGVVERALLREPETWSSLSSASGRVTLIKSLNLSG